jgi:pilus assembly protein CpaF
MSDDEPVVFGHKRTPETPVETAAPPLVRPAQTAARVEHDIFDQDINYPRAAAEIFAPVTPLDDRPDLNKLRIACLAKIEPGIVTKLQPEHLLTEVERLVSAVATELHIQANGSEQRRLAGELVDDMLGLGPLEQLLHDESVTDILVNGPDAVFVERRGKLEQVPVRFQDWQHLINICQRIASSVGRHVDEGSPMVDARLKDGSRVNIIIPPLTIHGAALSIRKFSVKTMDFERLISFGTLTPAMAHVLEIVSRCRLNIIISGGTGSGKTTLLNAMSHYIEPSERIITIEDVVELQLQQPDIVQMEVRPANVEGKGEVTTRDLVRNALRMRPDRIIVGEVRGPEAFDMLQAMNTGHAGSLSTIHANSTRDALSRIENMVQMANVGLSSKSIRTELVSAIHLIVQLDRQRDGTRRITEITEISGLEGETVLMREMFRLKIIGEEPNGKLISRYHVSTAVPRFLEQLTYFGLDKAWFAAMREAANDPTTLTEV